MAGPFELQILWAAEGAGHRPQRNSAGGSGWGCVANPASAVGERDD